jgi:uncharacterized membrane protein
MIEWIELLRWLHVIGAAVLLGTGAGIAFFMLMAHRTGDPAVIAHVAGTVVVADFLFTATAVILQPVTGLLLAEAVGWPLRTPWIVASLVLYVATGLCWLPVVWIQWRMRDLARVWPQPTSNCQFPIGAYSGRGSCLASPPSVSC